MRETNTDQVGEVADADLDPRTLETLNAVQLNLIEQLRRLNHSVENFVKWMPAEVSWLAINTTREDLYPQSKRVSLRNIALLESWIRVGLVFTCLGFQGVRLIAPPDVDQEAYLSWLVQYRQSLGITKDFHETVTSLINVYSLRQTYQHSNPAALTTINTLVAVYDTVATNNLLKCQLACMVLGVIEAMISPTTCTNMFDAGLGFKYGLNTMFEVGARIGAVTTTNTPTIFC